jgi:biopolymer transport protein TolR
MAFGIHRYSARGRSRRAPMAEINVTPLVDVMLVLLIVFMVTAPLLKAGVPVDLPESRAKALGEDAQQINLGMTRDGRLYLDDTEVPPGGLAARLSRFSRGDNGKLPLVTLRADKALDYGRVMAVMGELNRAGFTSISLVTTASAVEPMHTFGSDSGE